MPRHPSDLPDLPTYSLLQTLPVTVLAVDANLMIRDLLLTAKAARRADERPVKPLKPVAVLELLSAARVRIVMSATDLQPTPSGYSRLEQNILETRSPDAPEMLRLWREAFLPWVHVLDPGDLSPTPASLAVAARDADDEPLARLAHIVAADAFMTYDKHFYGDFPVLPSRGQHGMILSAFRDDLRVEEFQGQLVALPVLVGLGLHGGFASFARTLKVKPAALYGAALAVVGVSLLSRRWRTVLKTGAGFAVEVLTASTPTPDISRQLQDAQALVKFQPEVTYDPLVLVARELAHRVASCTSTELVTRLSLKGTPSQLAYQLREFPGLFEEVSRGRWTLRSAGRADKEVRKDHAYPAQLGPPE